MEYIWNAVTLVGSAPLGNTEWADLPVGENTALWISQTPPVSSQHFTVLLTALQKPVAHAWLFFNT